MLELELEIVLVCVRTEPDLLDDYLGCVSLHLLSFLFLLIEIFLIVHYLTYRRVSLSAYLHQIELLFLSHLQGISKREDSLFRDVLSYESYLRCCDLLIDSQSVVILLDLVRSLSWTTIRSWAGWAWTWFKWCCDKFILL